VLNGDFVIDAVAHAYNFTPENFREGKRSQKLAEMTYHGLHLGFQPRGDARWALTEDGFYDATDPVRLAHAFFEESQTDVCIYHSIPLYGLFKDGLSPLSVGKEMRELYPGRVLIYGGVSPWEDDVLATVDRLIQEDGISGLKVYPGDVIDGKMADWRLDDPEIAFPIIERARDQGIRNIAIHKAQPLGPVPMEPFEVRDIEGAAMAFPDVSFEVVHGGWAFLEETASQIARFENVSVNLECTTAYLIKAPRKFAQIVGELLLADAEDRLMWATGAMLYHPRPYLEAFRDFQMPADMVEGYGYPELTDELKAKILAGNQARLLGLDLDELKSELGTEERELAEPWSGGDREVSLAAAGGTV